jgi:flagellar hook-basal body complex protein FliE
MAIDPTMAVRGGEWAVNLGDGGIPAGSSSGTGGASGSGFGGMLANQLGALEKLQSDAAQGSQALAAGTATDPTAVVMAVERARLGMQLAGQIRTKAVEVVQDIFHTQV